MAIAKKVSHFMQEASWIRRMFEQGARLKKKYGPDAVFDFSLGNPNLEPPEAFFDALDAAVSNREPGRHGYMPNAGYSETREAIAEHVSAEHGMEIFPEHIIMSCGAGGALNVVLKTLLDPGDEVIIPAPCFVEYGFYVDNAGGLCRYVPTGDDFLLDVEAIAGCIGDRTKAVLINSPNNPTGRVYPRKTIEELGRLLFERSKSGARQIYLIADEPYRNILYDGCMVPSIFQAYTQSIIVTSYSKDLSIPGERIGFIAVHPEIEPREDCVRGLVFSTRTLGFVNAPALLQRTVRFLQGVSVDSGLYQKKRDALCSMLEDLGYDFVKPEGAFYLFPQAPADDVTFVKELLEEKILAVPGSGFGRPGYFRLAFCVDDAVIEGARCGFERLAAKYFL